MHINAAKNLTGGDVRAERHRPQPPIKQRELGRETGFFQSEISAIERGALKVVQEEYQRLLDAIERIVNEREKAGQG